jgi:hypothetical protein
MRGRAPDLIGSTVLAAAIIGCAPGDPPLAQADMTDISRLAIEEIRDRHALADTFAVSPNPRFLVPTEPGEAGMGPFNRWGDPALSAAISAVPGARSCPIVSGGDCARTGVDAFVAVSEIVRVARREAVVLVALVRRSEPQAEGDALVLHARRSGDAWRVARVTEAASVRLAAGLLPDGSGPSGPSGPPGPPGSP